ncbi:MAG: M20/M25/M40 family metallo-hydrolase [Oscillospiraceae bacterium]|nr:M20/M25/M40 family metallo-hydrolase [Oscillospiraceae bacterium]
MEWMELLNQLTRAFGPSGSEGGIRKTITDLIAPYVDEIKTDAMGNLIAHRKGEGKRLLFSAHMDSVGLLVTHVEKEGWLRFHQLGGLTAQDIRRQGVVFENGTRGVIAVPEDKEEDRDLKRADLFIDVGADSREEALKQVRPGDACVYTGTPFAQNGKVFSNYLDDRAGCAVLIEAARRIQNPQYDLYFLFSTQEEVGTRGVKPAAFGIDPDIGIAVDVTGSDDLPGSDRWCSSVLGKGAGIKVMDGSVVCQPELVAWMSAVAEAAEIPVQQDILRSGGTDAGAIQVTRGGVWAGGIDIPCRYTHAPVEVCALSDLEAAAALAARLAESGFDGR